MQAFLRTFAAIALLVSLAATANTQTAAVPPLLAAVRGAVAKGGLESAQKLLDEYRSGHGVTADVIESLGWLADTAFGANQLEQADRFAAEAHNLALAAFKSAAPGKDIRVLTALATGIAVQAKVLTEQGGRSQAIYFLRHELETYRDTPIRNRLEATISLLSLEGRPAPHLDTRARVGPRVPSFEDLKGKVVLMFFWAHWCSDCKAESPVIARVFDKYRAQGLVLIAPTQRYGYVEGGRTAPPDKELRYIMKVRDAHYPFLRNQPVPTSEANHRQFGVASIPLHVLIDRNGVVRVYQPGSMTEAELEKAIQPLL